jgi:hypothetical protein
MKKIFALPSWSARNRGSGGGTKIIQEVTFNL